MICCYFTVQPSSLRIENVTTEQRLLGTQEQDLVVSCTAIGGIPAPNVALTIEGKSIPSQTQSVQYTFKSIHRSYDQKTVTCQASNPAYLHDPMTYSAMVYLNCM
jgi:catabolite regulation protein CreA